ncbi:MAG: hypothetical protein KDD67_04545 [Ignavibacteriae bacterium]|nr:hypothetical protein [Ignavibacteriota bacterium]MCB9214877.1 hypothetical protein [Ignavibacteria bacterium]
MVDVRNLIETFAQNEANLRGTTFLAPALQGGKVRTRVKGIVYEFAIESTDFEGWGLFRPLDSARVEVVEEPSLYLVGEYLNLFPTLRLKLATQLNSSTWLAYPVNESDMRRRFGLAKPLPIHLVSEGEIFDQVVGGWDGANLWFREVDRRDDPLRAIYLRTALKGEVVPQNLKVKGLTPEEKTAYGIAFNQSEQSRIERERVSGERKVQDALRRAGGSLERLKDRKNYWLVEWKTSSGEVHTSAINKSDLTVIGAGICLSGRDRTFDLQSLVGVVEERPDWMR